MTLDTNNKSYGTGRRKTSAARVWYTTGNGSFVINKKPIENYFCNIQHILEAKEPLEHVAIKDYNINCTVKGGGKTGQAGAIKLGLSRALVEFIPDCYTILREKGCMTRDSRKVERKHYGFLKARKRTQFSKR